MTLSVETIIVVSLLMAVFAAVSTIGSSLYLGAGYERLRAGFETIKKQTAFFSEAIHKLDHRVDAVEKQSGYFFHAISALEQQAVAPPASDERWEETPAVEANTGGQLIMVSKDDVQDAGSSSLFSSGFLMSPPARTQQPADMAQTEESRPLFH